MSNSIQGFSVNGVVHRYDYNALANKPNFGGLSADVATALLQLASHLVYADSSGQTYYNDLETALAGAVGTFYSVAYNLTSCTTSNPATIAADGSSYTATLSTYADYELSSVSITMGGTDVTNTTYLNGTISIPSVTGNIVITAVATQRSAMLSSISAVYIQSGTVWSTDSLDVLKPDLVVTATWADSATSIVPATSYTLSGTLTTGTSTITVSYTASGVTKTDTFNVTVTYSEVPSQYTRVNYIENPNQTTSAPLVNTGVTTSSATSSLEVDIDFMMTSTEAWSSSEKYKYVFAINVGTGYATAGVCIGVAPDDYTVVAFNGVSSTIAPNGTTSVLNKRMSISATFTSTGSSITDGTLSDSNTGTGRNHGEPIYLYGLKVRPGGTVPLSYFMIAKIYGCTVRENGTAILNAIPCVRNSDNAAGFWDTVNENFITANGLVAG